MWLCAGDGTAAAVLVSELMGGAIGGVASEVLATSPSRRLLMPRVVLSLRPNAVALRRI